MDGYPSILYKNLGIITTISSSRGENTIKVLKYRGSTKITYFLKQGEYQNETFIYISKQNKIVKTSYSRLLR